jgi:predicted phage tail protein
MEKRLIAGAGGGGGGGGGKGGGGGGGGSANVTRDNLDSRQVARIIDLLGEGEIEGFPSAKDYAVGTTNYNVAMLKDVYLNNTPILRGDADPTNAQASDYNFDITNAVFEFRTGTQNQTYTQNVGDANQSTTLVNTKVTQASAVTRSITDTDVNAVRVTIGTPALQKFKNNGDVEGAVIQYRIQTSYSGGPFSTVIEQEIRGRTADLYQRIHRIDLTAAPPVDIRVVRVNADAAPSGNETENSDFYWYDYTEKINAKTTYPNSALFAVKLNAEQFSSIPSRAYKIRGIKVRIPNNATVNPQNGRLIYAGTWNGTFAAAQWTTDPAWILWDLLVSKRYGFGDHVDAAQLDKWSFLAASQYCAEVVADGKGGQEPRFACNVVIQTQEEAFKLINDLCSVFRAMPFWSAGALEVSQDRPQDYSYIFNQTNVTEEGFTYSGSSLKTRHTVAVVQYFDMDLRDLAYEVVEDKEGIDKFGVVKIEVSAFACTSQGQARRVGEWLLYTEQNETEIVSFSTDIAAGITVRPGDLIKIGDPVRAGVMRSGRCTTGSTTTRVRLDRTDVDLFPSGPPASFTFNVLLPSGQLAINEASSLVGNSVFTGSTLTEAPAAGAPWTIGTTEVQMSTWRVLNVKETDGATYDITAVAYNSTKYDYVERDVPLGTRDVSDLNEPPLAPTNLIVNEVLYESNGQVLAKLIVGWRAAERALTYEVRYRYNNGNWVTTNVRSVDFEIQNSDVGRYEIEVTAVGAINSKRSTAATQTYDAIGKTAPPETIPDLFIAPIDEHTAELYWPQAVDLDVKIGGKVRIRHTPLTDVTATWGRSNDIVPAVAGSSTRKIVPLLEGTYFIRAVDSLGNESADTASVVVDLPAPQDLFLVQEYREEDNSPPFNGAATDMYYNETEVGLVLSADELIDDMATDNNWDGLGLIDYIGGAVSEGEYQFAETLDLGAVYDLGLQQILKTRSYEPGNTWDERLELIDLWDDIDGDDLGAANCQLFVRTTSDNPSSTPTWRDWQPFVNNNHRGRGFQFKLVATSSNPAQNVVVEELGVKANFERRTEQQRNLSSAAAAYSVTFPTAFYGTPSVGITAQDMATGDYFTLSSISRTGFTVTFRNSGGSMVSKTFDYQAVGHGRQIT